MVEITTRTTGGRLLLRPHPELNALILGILGRALCLYPVSLHAFVFLSTHWHALATVENADRLSSFVGYLNGNIAKAVKKVHGWTEDVWARRAQVIPVVDDEAAEQRLRYLLAHGVKEGLVATPLEWPGVSSTEALLLGEDMVGIWRSRSAQSRARRDEVEEVRYPIVLTPIPAWTKRPHVERRARMEAMIAAEIELEQASGRCPLGVDAICAQDPRSRPRELVRRVAPVVHAVVEQVRDAFLEARSSFIRLFRSAREAMSAAARELAATFPLGAFPPRLPAATCAVAVSDAESPVPDAGAPPAWRPDLAAGPPHPRSD